MKPHLNKHLKALVLSIFIFSPAAFSNIIYTDLNPDVTRSCEALFTTCIKLYAIDIDKDGTNDFELVDHIIFIYGVGEEMVKIRTLNNNQVDVDKTDLHAKALSSNAVINGGEQWAVDTSWGNILSETTGGPYTGHWTNNTVKFLGVRLKRGTDYHYGWIRMAVRVKTNSGLGTAAFRVFDYAVNSAPNEPILAGQVSGVSSISSIAADDIFSDNVRNDFVVGISPNPVMGDHLKMKINSVNPVNADLIVVNAESKIFFREGTDIPPGSSIKSIDISTLPAGIYYLKVITKTKPLGIKFIKSR